jgi:hypothetical protein
LIILHLINSCKIINKAPTTLYEVNAPLLFKIATLIDKNRLSTYNLDLEISDVFSYRPTNQIGEELLTILKESEIFRTSSDTEQDSVAEVGSDQLVESLKMLATGNYISQEIPLQQAFNSQQQASTSQQHQLQEQPQQQQTEQLASSSQQQQTEQHASTSQQHQLQQQSLQQPSSAFNRRIRKKFYSCCFAAYLQGNSKPSSYHSSHFQREYASKMNSDHLMEAFSGQESHGVLFEKKNKRFLVWVGTGEKNGKTFLKCCNFFGEIEDIDQEKIEWKASAISSVTRIGKENWYGVKFENCPGPTTWDCRSKHVSKALKDNFYNRIKRKNTKMEAGEFSAGILEDNNE